MAAIALNTVLMLSEVLAKGRLIQVVELLASLLWLALHYRNWYELSDRRLDCLGRVQGQGPDYGGE